MLKYRLITCGGRGQLPKYCFSESPSKSCFLPNIGHCCITSFWWSAKCTRALSPNSLRVLTPPNCYAALVCCPNRREASIPGCGAVPASVYCNYSALDNGHVSAEARSNPEAWIPTPSYDLTEHERLSLRRQVLLPDMYAACAVAGSVFKGWKSQFQYDSSAAWIKWEDDIGNHHLQLARVCYFLSISACMYRDCPEQVIALVRWFQVQNGIARLTLRSQFEFVFVKHFQPVRVAMVTDKSVLAHMLARKGSPHAARDAGPFRVLTLERTRWQ
jgi:hypothetical protein